MTELWQQGAAELAAMIAGKEASSTEVVEAHLSRIDKVNPHLNAVTRVLGDDARAAAKEADAAVANGEPLGPLHGVPFTVKQNIDLAGCATDNGVPAFAAAISPVDAPVVERMKVAGAIPIGRTNCPDMALRVHTDSSLHGLTRNPWDPTRTAGGSSGGEASALASGMSPLGLGNDIGGSLRNPATCCGIASLKPSAGMVPEFAFGPMADGPASFQLMPVEGPMARRIADVRIAFGLLAGRDPRDPYSLPVPIGSKRVEGRPLRVAVLADPPGGSTDSRVADCVTAAAAVLADAGYEVTTHGPPRFEEVVATWFAFIGEDIRTMSPLITPIMGDDGNRFLAALLGATAPLDLGGYTQVLMTRQALMRDWGMWFAQTDLVLTPTWTQLPFPHGWDLEHPAETLELMRCVTPANLLGLPSACVPAGLVDGVPVGVLLTGDRFADDKTLDAAEIVEAALGLATPIDPKT
jgi:amidase